MFNWPSCVPRFGSKIRKGTERLGWAISSVLVIRLWATLLFFCLSSISTAQPTKSASQSARPSLISTSLAPAAAVNHKTPTDKTKAVELKLPKAVIEALKKGAPNYGVKTEVLRAVKLKPTKKIGVSSSALDNMANPSRTHQVDTSKSPTIDEKAIKPKVIKNSGNEDTIVARSIRIKSPGQQALDSVNIALPSQSRGNENGNGSKIYAPRRVGFDTKVTRSALDSIQQKLQSVLPDTARPDVDAKISKQQNLNSRNGINRGQTKPKVIGGTEADSVEQTAAGNTKSVEQKSAVDKTSIVKHSAVDKTKVVKKSAVDKKGIVKKAAVDQTSIVKRSAADKTKIVKKSAVDKEGIVKKAAVDKEGIVKKAAVDKKGIIKKAAVDKTKIVKKASVDKEGIIKKSAVDKEVIEEKGTVDLSSKFKAVNDAASGSISEAISGKEGSRSSVTANGMGSSIVNTDSVSKTLDKQAKAFGAKGDADRKAADNVSVPAVTQDCVKKTKNILTLWKTVCDKTAPNAASVAANSSALGKKKSLNEQAKGNYNAANKIDAKRSDLIRTQGGYTSADALPTSGSYGSVNASVNGSQPDKSANQSDTQQHQKNTHNPYSMNHDASKHRVLELSSVDDFIIALGDINASIGVDSEAIQQIATVQGNVTGSPSFNVLPLTTRSGLINASIGYKSLARQTIDQLGDNDRDTKVPNGAVTFSGETVGGVNASIGSNSKAYHLQSLVSGRFQGANVLSMSDGFVNASIGFDTTSKLRLSVFEGEAPFGSLDLSSATAGIVAAAIGYKSTANFSAASGQNVTSGGNVKLHAIAPGAIVASIGSNTSATTLLASATGASASSIDVSVTGLLPSIAAAIGVNSSAHNRVGVLRENVAVGGEWQANMIYGQLTAFSLGSNAHALNEIGVISANVSGDIKQKIVVGAMLAGTLGSNTEATNKVGNVEARVNGNVTTNINILDVNTLSLGLTSGVHKKIYARTLIGNVFPSNSGSAYGTIKKDITITGPIVNLGIGLIIDLGFLGPLDLSSAGCVNIGNNGANPCN